MPGLTDSIGWGEVLAVATSLSYSVTLIAIRQGMRTGSPLAGVLVINGVVSLWGFTVALARGTLLTSGLAPIVYFALGGCVGQGLGQLAYSVGIQRMGVSRAVPVQSSTPIWAVAFAVVFLGERPGLATWLGTAAIVGGVSLLSVPEGEGGNRFRDFFQGALVYPLVSSLLYAMVPIFAKKGFAYQSTPMVGVGIAFLAGTLSLLAGRPLLGGSGGAIRADRRALRWFALAAVCTAAAATLFWTALTIAPVSVVLPLSRLVPLWVLIWSFLFLGQLERITPRVVAAAAMVVAGGVLVTAFR